MIVTHANHKTTPGKIMRYRHVKSVDNNGIKRDRMPSQMILPRWAATAQSTYDISQTKTA
jgi:hypothetical protein